VVNLLVFFLAFFLDFFELSFIVIPLLGPAADQLGIDLIWFGVLLGVNLQTSFLHPPFGFALFYLRSVAPAHDHTDKITGRRLAGVTTGQLYWGAIPFVLIQLIMVALLITFPAMSLVYKAGEKPIDINKVKIEIPTERFDTESSGDLMKDLGGSKAPPSAPAEPGGDKGGGAANDDLMKELGGKK